MTDEQFDKIMKKLDELKQPPQYVGHPGQLGYPKPLPWNPWDDGTGHPPYWTNPGPRD